MRRKLFLLALAILLLSGCTTVKPWEKEHLSKTYMSFDPDPLEASYTRHVQSSKEGSGGGYGVGIGACGCH